MGMDVKGKNGKYFSANCWGWRPLWDYCHSVAPHIIDEKTYKACHYNDGKGLNSTQSEKLGMLLLTQLAGGQTSKYIADRDKMLSVLPQRECPACDNGKIVMLSTENNQYDTKRVPCMNCKGTGFKENFEKSYSFSIKTVNEWAEFLLECDGFEVW